MKALVVTLAVLACMFTLQSCSKNSPTDPSGSGGVVLSTFNYKVGDTLIYRSEATSAGRPIVMFDTISVKSITGGTGAQILTFDDGSTLTMRSGKIYADMFGKPKAIAAFPSKKGDTLSKSLDTLIFDGAVRQIFDYTITMVYPDTTMSSSIGNQRCCVVATTQYATMADGVAPITQIGSIATSPTLGFIGFYTESWAGLSASGEPFARQTTELIAIRRK